MKKGGLGRGLNNFLKDTDEVAKILNEEPSGITKIEISKIKPNEKQARKLFNEEKLKELSESIAEFGVIQPLILKQIGEEYQIIAGERRYRAAKMAALEEVPAIIKNISEEEADKISLIENVQRVDLNPIEEALGYKSVMKEYGITQEELSDAIGKSRQYIGNTVRLLKLEPRVIEFLQKGLLTTSHGKLLLGIKDPKQQYREAKRIVKLGNTVKETTLLFSKPVEKTKNIFLDNARRDLEDALGTKVEFKGKGKNKKIVIEYYSEEDLERICERILGSEEE
ncbi:chromosome partitioning protein, ParB family [Peptoniphilus asaccharolyticus DSM 20463]|uniref:Chromosome partitioning protein, ParB family n=1 Tax=Peptoniphilus asaccharolyticus DSM 20463 TaxID=573058 RepID=A0A1W1V437_PEPAS|nr:ParB/RepB/Spo0J family partition protein [Peptoniphilus asaccharolyticus]MBL7576283.1 ParB/RepB/Spo0J family partition protein [Peptoniphilus asaccharolyticus]SMB88092.1 chromosome partitioning protein, ParB family [Peptoniphilus asaccharolyticus DSM 20463]